MIFQSPQECVVVRTIYRCYHNVASIVLFCSRMGLVVATLVCGSATMTRILKGTMSVLLTVVEEGRVVGREQLG